MDHVGSRFELYEQWEEHVRLAAEFAQAQSKYRAPVKIPIQRGITLRMSGSYEMFRFRLEVTWREALCELLRAAGHDAGIEDDARVACRLDIAIGSRLVKLVADGDWGSIRELLLDGTTDH